MYLPNHFNSDNYLHEIINRYPLATLVSSNNDSIEINPYPLVISHTSPLNLIGHLSRNNPQLSHFKAGVIVTAVFNGPNTFINSNWYESHDVPTWSYIQAQITGKISLVEDKKGILQILRKSVDHTEKLFEKWDFKVPTDLTGDLLEQAICGFSIIADKVEVKLKLSQNRSNNDKQNVIRELCQRKDAASNEVAWWMKKIHNDA